METEESYLILAFAATKAKWKLRNFSGDSNGKKRSEANLILIDGKPMQPRFILSLEKKAQ